MCTYVCVYVSMYICTYLCTYVCVWIVYRLLVAVVVHRTIFGISEQGRKEVGHDPKRSLEAARVGPAHFQPRFGLKGILIPNHTRETLKSVWFYGVLELPQLGTDSNLNWVNYGASMGFLWALYGPMDFLWVFYGISMDLWAFYGLMGLLWAFYEPLWAYGLSTGFLWTYGPSMGLI